jgi:phospholipid/cholesterol/gamma-HCH transport system substrate-binding protein
MFDMKKHLMWSKLKVGAVVTAALAVILITVIFAGSLENLFSNNITIFAQIKDVRGLRSGSPVWLSGIEEGSVKDIRLHSQYGTLVTLAISSDAAEFVKKDSTATVMTMGLLGDKYVDISNGTDSSDKIGAKDVLKGKVQLEMGDIVEATAGSLSKVSDVIEQLGLIVKKIDNSEGTVGKLLSDPSVFNNLRDSTKSLSVVFNNLRDSTRSLSVTLNEIETSKGTLRLMINDPSLYNNLDKASRNLTVVLEGLDAGKGTAGKLLKDEEMAKQLQEAVTGINQTVFELKDMLKDIKGNPKKYFKFSVF